MKTRKTTRPFKYDLNQSPYDYTVEVMNRFKGLDLVDRVPEELWTEVGNLVQEAVTKTIPKKKKCRKAFLNEQSKEIGKNNRMRKTRDFFKKIGDIKKTFHARMNMIKDRNGKDLTEAEEIKRWQEHIEKLCKKR